MFRVDAPEKIVCFNWWKIKYRNKILAAGLHEERNKEIKKENYRAWTKIDKITKEGEKGKPNLNLTTMKANASEWGEKSVLITWRLKCEQTIWINVRVSEGTRFLDWGLFDSKIGGCTRGNWYTGCVLLWDVGWKCNPYGQAHV